MNQIDDAFVAGQLMPLDPDWGQITAGFVYIPKGEFMMGSESSDWEKPVHKVIISKSFEMCRYQITQQQWQAVMGKNPSKFRGDNLPVETVSWLDVEKFINKLNAKSNKYVYALPTEAQWEYACRAGITEDYLGNLDDIAWYRENSASTTHPVGEKLPNSWGIYDCQGNVWEWCLDWYGDYPNEEIIDPVGASLGSYRVIRGGSCISLPARCRLASRYINLPADHYFTIGFRLVRNIK